jgi:hypothetical protein
LTADGTDKFGTYFRDGSGQDYAHSRYYNSNTGRFLSPDRAADSASGAALALGAGTSLQAPADQPGTGSADPNNPVSWNRYAYALDDPTNQVDPTGFASFVEEDGVQMWTGSYDGEQWSTSNQNLQWDADSQTWVSANTNTNQQQLQVDQMRQQQVGLTYQQIGSSLSLGSVPTGSILTGPAPPITITLPKPTLFGCIINPEWILSFYDNGPGDSLFHHGPGVIYTPTGPGGPGNKLATGKKPGQGYGGGGRAGEVATGAAGAILLLNATQECLALPH